MNIVNACFLGLPLPAKQVEQFQTLLSELKSLKLPVKFQKANTPHLTMLYFGDIREDKLPKIEAKAAEIATKTAKFELAIEGSGYFGSKRYPRVAWLGTRDTRPLATLQKNIRIDLGVYCQKKDDRPFHAHLTVARVTSAKTFLKAKDQFESICDRYTFTFVADRLRLYVAYPQEQRRQVPLKDFDFTS